MMDSHSSQLDNVAVTHAGNLQQELEQIEQLLHGIGLLLQYLIHFQEESIDCCVLASRDTQSNDGIQ